MPRHAKTRGFVRTAITAPVAVFGTLAATLSAAPAQAETGPTSLARATSPSELGRLSSFAPRATSLPTPVIASTPVIAAASAPIVHTVVSGDTVWGIAQRYGSTVAAILSANGIGSNALIFPGQRIVIPGTGAPASSPAAPSTPAPSTPAPSAASYTVVRGDTVWGIAQRYGSTVAAILSANGIGSNAIIYPGQVLTIPGSGTPAALPPTTPTTPAPTVPETSTPEPSTPAPSTPAPSAASYTVVRGDTVWGIAQRYGSTVAAILSANGIGSNAIIYPGQVLTIPGASTASSGTPTSFPAGQKSANLDAEQIENARLIIAIGRELGVSERGIAIALATAMVESWIRNLDWGDRDSLGLFQQRPSTGWGTPEQILDRNRSIRVFYGGPLDPNGTRTRGLLDIPGWESLPFTQAAQRVQISAFPDRYGQWEQAAYEWIRLYG